MEMTVTGRIRTARWDLFWKCLTRAETENPGARRESGVYDFASKGEKQSIWLCIERNEES